MLFDEARTHGAGFYRFSRDEVTRAAEQEELKDMHEETKKVSDVHFILIHFGFVEIGTNNWPSCTVYCKYSKEFNSAVINTNTISSTIINHLINSFRRGWRWSVTR